MLTSESYSSISRASRCHQTSNVFDRVYLVFLMKSIRLPSHLLDYEILLLNKPRVVQMSTRGIIRMPCAAAAAAAAFSHLLKGKWLWINEAGSTVSSVTAVDVWLYIGSLGNEMLRLSETLGMPGWNPCQKCQWWGRRPKEDSGMTAF